MADSDAPRILGRTEPCKGPQARPGPKGHPPEHYERVAAAYRQALISHPRSPMRALAEQLHASDATVRRWVQRARDKGLLGPSVPGKAGETAT
jgi:transposase-like protein